MINSSRNVLKDEDGVRFNADTGKNHWEVGGDIPQRQRFALCKSNLDGQKRRAREYRERDSLFQHNYRSSSSHGDSGNPRDFQDKLLSFFLPLLGTSPLF